MAHSIDFRNSLTAHTLLQMAIRITLIVLAVTGLTYWHIITTLEEETKDKLKKYITERGSKESTIFLLAEDNHKVFGKKFLEFRKNMPDVTDEEFNKFFEKYPDGTTRLRKETYTGLKRHDGWVSKHTTGFVGKNAPVENQEFRNRLVLGYNLVDQFGDAWTNRFANVYIAMPENVNIVYWAGIPWAWNADSNLDVTTEEWVYIANFENNPKRESVWTGLYYDQTADEWMVSCETPIDEDGKNLINVGHDILLNKLFDRVFSDSLKGTYNFIFREDGRLIAHPNKVKELQKALGVLAIKDVEDPELSGFYHFISESLKNNNDSVMVLDDESRNSLLAISRIQGPDWWFVTVYPKSLLATTARSTAKFILILGVISLILELLMLFMVLREKVVKPLEIFMDASDKVAKGDYAAVVKGEVGLPVNNKDEVGMLARAIRNMAENIDDLRENLEKKVAERTSELEVLSEKAKHASEAKSDFLARMSHEIRTPMNAIIGLSRLTLNSELNAKQRDYLEKVVASSDALLGVINDVLDYSKIEAGKLTLESRTFEINEVLKNVGTVTSLRAQTKGLELLYVVDQDVPRILEGDSLRLGQVLINLANNSVKFTEKGEVLIRIEKVSEKQGKVLLRFVVEDTGIGIESNQIEELFSPFSQADGSITRRFGGTGLGLAICKQITSLMNGDIYVESEVGKGSRFIFTSEFGIGEETSPFLLEKLKNLRVLIVDDNSSAREVFTHILLGFGMRPDTAKDGMTALTMLRDAEDQNDCYKLVLLDWNMPGMDGIETARYIREKGGFNGIPAILMVTAYGHEEVSGLLSDVGIGHLLTKPVNESLLHDTIVESLLNDEIIELRKGYRQKVKDENRGLTSVAGANILLVEDSPLNREVAIEFLKEANVNVDIATNGREAVEKVQSGNYCLVFMDIQMPEMDGITATKLIRSDAAYKDLPIIAMTAHAMVGDREKSIDAGMNDHITKPIDPEVLYETLEKWIKVKVAGKVVENVAEDACEVQTNDEPAEFMSLDGIDTRVGLKMNMDKKELYLKIMRMFQSEYRDAGSRINNHIEKGDFKEARRIVHTLKSASASIGAEELARRGHDLEMLLADSKIELPLIESFNKELDRILVSLQELPPAEEEMEGDEHNSISQESVNELIDKLEKLLASHDAEAEMVLEELSLLSLKQEMKDKVSEIIELVEDVEYEEALLLVKTLKTEEK